MSFYFSGEEYESVWESLERRPLSIARLGNYISQEPLAFHAKAAQVQNVASDAHIDECAVVNGGCQQRCINTLGTFHCVCDTGYRRHADERTCIRNKTFTTAIDNISQHDVISLDGSACVPPPSAVL
ncbi:hypothetical protein ACRRTK_010284 [Alexandromys fortis]